jgi:asparagine synthase (glutamine-hydrolysing)
MCGIAGYYNANIDKDVVNQVVNKLKHRGPDSEDVYISEAGTVGLIHTRLSVIELSSLGSQPYRFKNLVLTYNGEIYNYKDVRQDLTKLGYNFQSNSDTEVLIKAYHCWKESCVNRFIGMFAFCIYDEATNKMVLFRDRVGVKPLYYSFTEGSIFFASEMKALAAFPIHKEINLNAVAVYLRFGFIPAHMSIFCSVNKLESGHYLEVTSGGINKIKYWNPGRVVNNTRKEADLIEELETTMISAFEYRMVSDVPVGVFLSGGLDSSLLISILQRDDHDLRTFTIGFEESDFDESPHAKQIAKFLGTHHTEKILHLDQARGLLSNFYSIYDEPFADTSGIPTACVANLAKEKGVKVVLSADGGDEIFGGYTHYVKALKLYGKFKHLPLNIRKAIAKSTRTVFSVKSRRQIPFLNLEHRLYALEELLEQSKPLDFFESFIANQSVDEIKKMLNITSVPSFSKLTQSTEHLQQMMDWDFSCYLPDNLLVKVDRATMYYGIECRDPFLDHRLVELSFQIPTDFKIRNGQGKYLLRKLLTKYVPQEYTQRRKQGFSIPIFSWFSKELDYLFDYYLSSDHVAKFPFLHNEDIQSEFKKYKYFKKAGKQYNIEKMWRILSFMLWADKYYVSET